MVLKDVDSHGMKNTRNDVTAVVQLVVWMSKDGCVSWEKFLVVKDNPVCFEVVGLSVDVGSRTDTTRRFRDQAKVGSKLRRCPICADQNPSLEGFTLCR